MKFALVDEWWTVLKKSWSVRLMAASGLIEIAYQSLPFLQDHIPWWASVAIVGVGIVARITAQKGMQKGMGPDDDYPTE